MVKVENQSTLWLLTLRFLKINRGRNAIAILAIILTTLLFTSLFTGATSMMLSKLAADQKTYSSWSHAVLQDITEEDALRIAAVLQETQSVKQFGMDTFVGLVQDEQIMSQTEIRAADFYAAKSFGSIPTKGRLPEKIDEIAVSTITLDSLGLPREIGTKISFVSFRSELEERQHCNAIHCNFTGNAKRCFYYGSRLQYRHLQKHISFLRF